MQLSDQQVKIMGRCSMCQVELVPERVRESLESGANPGTMFCQTCGEGGPRLHEAIFQLAATRSAELVAERAREAGLEEHFTKQAAEWAMRSRGEHN